jgi:hypothetical protein
MNDRVIGRIKLEAEQQMVELLKDYGVCEDETPEYVVRALEAVVTAKSIPEAEKIARKAVKKMEFHCIAYGACKRARKRKKEEDEAAAARERS